MVYENVCMITSLPHTQTRLTALFPGLPRWAGTRRKVKPLWILLKQQTVSGSGISWAICKSAPCSRQITMPAPHHSFFTGWMPFLPPNQQRQSTEGISLPTKRISAILQWKHLSEFYPQDGGERQLASKLRHCHPMYRRVRIVPLSISPDCVDCGAAEPVIDGDGESEAMRSDVDDDVRDVSRHYDSTDTSHFHLQSQHVPRRAAHWTQQTDRPCTQPACK